MPPTVTHACYDSEDRATTRLELNSPRLKLPKFGNGSGHSIRASRPFVDHQHAVNRRHVEVFVAATRPEQVQGVDVVAGAQAKMGSWVAAR